MIKDDHSDKPFEVKAGNGKTWWYKSEAIEAVSAICDVAGCSRATWNGDSGGQCCRTCKASDGARHGPDCEAKAKADVSRNGAGEMPSQTDYIRLTGAGGVRGMPCNGVYQVSGMHNGKPLYVQKGGDAKVYFNGHWKVSHSGTTTGWVYGVSSEAGRGSLPPVMWRTDGYLGSDASPSPTLEFISGIPSGCCVVTKENYRSQCDVVRGPAWKWDEQDGGPLSQDSSPSRDCSLDASAFAALPACNVVYMLNI